LEQVEKNGSSKGRCFIHNGLNERSIGNFGSAFKDIVKNGKKLQTVLIINNNETLNNEMFQLQLLMGRFENIKQVMSVHFKNTLYNYHMSKNRVITIN